jgi:menaquinone-dependent protoporphyrinogen oxidase
MHVLIAYATRLGSTRGIAERIAERLDGAGLAATAVPVGSVTDLRAYDAFVVGSAVYAGHWMTAAGRFIEDNRPVLATHPVWLFSSGPVGDVAAGRPPIAPLGIEALAATVSARGHRIFGGALDRRTLDDADFGTVERIIARRFVPEGDFRAWPEIDAWADAIAHHLSGVPAGLD